ncbi:hypothetical protein ACH5RR_022299 [Cinchona calisaya]|uniref:Dentin sialophosphoprotein-like n=1 Tax=Cinchona calisaya TaxID=153742 RepID=A0ABD2Z7E1_9GENT
MFKQLPSRSQRSRGIKVKHVLQTCFLLAICFWLIYQVKHSHDKKKELDESDMKNSQLTQGSSEVVKLGRKDLNPRVDETGTTSTKQDEEAEDENVGEEEENKNDEEHVEDKKSEEKDDDGGGVGDNEVDDRGEEKSDSEVDHEEDVTEEEKEKEKDEADEKENKEKDSEDKSKQLENENSLEEHDDDDDEKAHEAREEHYKADDASSAVTHETEDFTAQNENRSSESSNELAGKNVVESQNIVNTEKNDTGENTTGSKIENREMTENVATVNDDNKNVGSKSDDGSSSINSTLTEIPNDHQELINDTAEASAGGGAYGLSTQNGAETEPQNVTTESTTSGDGTGLHSIPSDQGNNSSLSSTENHADPDISLSLKVDDFKSNSGEASKTNNSTQSIMPEKSVNSSTEAEENSRSSTTETHDATEAENTEDTSDGTDDGTENPGEVQNDPLDSSDSSMGLIEKDVRTDLETLPEIQTEGSHDEDAAAE